MEVVQMKNTKPANVLQNVRIRLRHVILTL